MATNISGLDSLILKLERLSTPDRKQFLEKVGAMVERDAKINCPVDTGELRNSIRYETDESQCAIGTNLEYAPYVHQGTGLFAENGDGRQDVPWVYQDASGEWHTTLGQKPQPFLTQALDQNREQIIELFHQMVKESVK